MSTGQTLSKLFACCGQYQHSICLKLWIIVFVCSLLCFTCLVIENRRDGIIQSRDSKLNQSAQKLIQIKSSFNNNIAKSEEIEESSGHYGENISIRSDHYLIEGNELHANNHSNRDNNSLEMIAASNCVSKSSNHFTNTEIGTDREVKDYNCKDLIEQVEQLLEFPEFSETKANDIFLDYEAEFPAEQHHRNEYEWVGNLEEEDDLLPLRLEEDDEPIYQFEYPENSNPEAWDSEDRFFPDEYAFQTKSPEDVYAAEIRSIVRSTNDILTERISPSDIPSMIDTFLGRISTFFVPPMHIRKPDLSHLNNFHDIPMNVESMRLASSKDNPVWKPNSSKLEKSYHTKTIKNHRKNGKLFPKLIQILQQK